MYVREATDIFEMYETREEKGHVYPNTLVCSVRSTHLCNSISCNGIGPTLSSNFEGHLSKNKEKHFELLKTIKMEKTTALMGEH